MLVISTPLGFLSIGQGGKKSRGTLCMAFPLQTQVEPLALLPATCHHCSSLSLPKRPKPQQIMLHMTPGSSIAALPRAKSKVMWIREWS